MTMCRMSVEELVFKEPNYEVKLTFSALEWERRGDNTVELGKIPLSLRFRVELVLRFNLYYQTLSRPDIHSWGDGLRVIAYVANSAFIYTTYIMVKSGINTGSGLRRLTWTIAYKEREISRSMRIRETLHTHKNELNFKRDQRDVLTTIRVIVAQKLVASPVLIVRTMRRLMTVSER